MYLLHVLVAGCHVGGYFCPSFQSVVDSSLFNTSYSHTRLVELGPWKDRRTEGVPYLIPRLLVELVTLFLKNLTFTPVLFCFIPLFVGCCLATKYLNLDNTMWNGWR